MQPPDASPTVRVALRVPDGRVPAYLLRAARQVEAVAGAEVVLVIAATPDPDGAAPRGGLTRRIDGWYDRLERRFLRGGPRALLLELPGRWPDGVPLVRGRDIQGQSEALRAAGADVLIDLAPEAPAMTSPIPGGGIWRLRFADGVGEARRSSIRRSRLAFGLAESVLSIQLGPAAWLETGRGVGANRRIGATRDHDAIYWRSSLLPARRLVRLVSGEDVGRPGVDVPAETPDPNFDRPTSSDRPPFGRLAATVAGKILERLWYRAGWCVLVRGRRNETGVPPDLSGFDPVVAPPGRFYADPFVVATDQGPILYVEDCPDGVHQGRISVVRRSPDGDWGLDRIVLADVAHRSYPHVLRTNDGLVFTPDGGRGGGVDFFRDRGAPEGADVIARCLEGTPASDPTLLWQDGRYWLFVTVTEHGMYPWDELHLFTSSSMEGPWDPHPRNPIVADVRGARPAGRIFRQGDVLIRPGQDCSKVYGGRILLFAITTLTLDAYDETPVGAIEPSGMPGVTRTHTYSFDGAWEALDGYRRVRRWSARDQAPR